mgnify:FL=1
MRCALLLKGLQLSLMHYYIRARRNTYSDDSRFILQQAFAFLQGELAVDVQA